MTPDRVLELTRTTLEFAGATGVDVVMSDRLAECGYDGMCVIGTDAPTVSMSTRLEQLDPSYTVWTAIHEAAHLLSGDAGHGHAFDEQWRRMSTREYADALGRHLSGVGSRP